MGFDRAQHGMRAVASVKRLVVGDQRGAERRGLGGENLVKQARDTGPAFQRRTEGAQGAQGGDPEVAESVKDGLRTFTHHNLHWDSKIRASQPLIAGGTWQK